MAKVIILLITALMLVWIVGCGEDDFCDSNVPPTVTLSPPGGDIFVNNIITATCSKPVEKLIIEGRSDIIVTSTDKKVWTFSFSRDIGEEQSITVICTDSCGDNGSATGTYNAWSCGISGPELDGEACDPEDGAEDIDPENISKIILVFDQLLSGAEITSFEPEADISSELDGDTLTISFLGGYRLPNEQEVVIELIAEDLAGNTADVEYSFTTKAKE